MSLLGIDLGTTGCKAAAFSLDGRLLSLAYMEYPTIHPCPGQAEIDSRVLWRQVRDVIAQAAVAAGGDKVTALSISSFGEAMVPVSNDREILGNAILSIDDRGGEHIRRLKADFSEEAFYRINPNIPGSNYSLSKLLWLREAMPHLVDKADKFLLIADWVAFMLGCEGVASNSLANRTLLLNLEANDWSDELLHWSNWPREKLGRVVSGGTVLGTITPKLAAELHLSPGAKVVAGGHDQCLSALGCGCVHAGSAACGIGTFECLTPVYRQPEDVEPFRKARLSIEHHVVKELCVSFLYNQAGSLVKWFRRTFATSESGQFETYDCLSQELPCEPTNLLVLPHFEAPQWPEQLPDVAGAIIGLKTTTTRGEILRAIMESATYYFADSLHALEPLGARPEYFVASGGGAKSDTWLQIHADILDLPFRRLSVTECGCLGAAMLAGLSTAALDSPRESVEMFVKTEAVFEPDASRHEAYRERLAIYRDLYPTLKGIHSRLRRII